MRIGMMLVAMLGGCAGVGAGSADAADQPPDPWRVVAASPADELAPRRFSRLIPVPELDRAVLWGSPGKGAADWTAIALDLATDQWKPLPPTGKEGWPADRPQMRYAQRWGQVTQLQSPEDILQPSPMCYFNQAVWVPPIKRVLFLVGGRQLTFDPATGLWEESQVEGDRPPHVVWSALCYDPVNDEVVLFGGGAQCDENRPGTWLMDARTGRWRKLDQPLAEQPPARCNAPLAYDSKNRLIAVFGGDAQTHFRSDTWVYDCATRRWRELKTNVRPYPRQAPALCFDEKSGLFIMGGQAAGRNPAPAIGQETWALDAAAGTWTRLVGQFPGTGWTSAIYDAARGRVLVYQAARDPAVHELRSVQPSTEPGTPAPDTPIALYHGPEGFTEGVEPPDPKQVRQFLADLPVNRWTRVELPKTIMHRTWGSATVDADRDEVLYWGGGHCGYCGTDVVHFSLKTLRWTGSFAPEFPPAPYNPFYGEESSFLLPCRSFAGRTFVQHGRTSYAYDPTTRLAVFTQGISYVPTRGWTYVYDPAKRDFVDRFTQPFIGGWSVSGSVTTTRRGVYNYLTPGDHRSEQVGLFRLDPKARAWVNLSDGKATAPCFERQRMVYDSKRDRLVLISQEPTGGRDARPAMYAWPLADEGAKDWSRLEMTGQPPKAFYRESVYIERHDRMLNLSREEGLFACDLSDGHRWSATGIPVPDKAVINPNTVMVYVPGPDLLVLLYAGNTGPTGVWLMRYDPAGPSGPQPAGARQAPADREPPPAGDGPRSPLSLGSSRG